VATSPTSVLSLRDVSKSFPVRGQRLGQPQRRLLAVAPTNLQLEKGEILAVVGESGCGKSTLGRLASFVTEPSAGTVAIEGVEPSSLPKREARLARRSVQIVHQDPYSALNPRKTVGQTLVDPFLAHHLASRREAMASVRDLLNLVGMHPPDEFLDRYPFELSGGQRQRVVIARALTVSPKVIVADEAVSMVDVSLRQSILTTLGSLRDRLGVAFLFITHDLALAHSFAGEHRTLVMYAGHVMEYGRSQDVIERPLHPYTRLLHAALLDPDPENNEEHDLAGLEGELPDLSLEMQGCPFASRCPFAQDVCRETKPQLAPRGDAQAVACHFDFS
jgi:oligopeptide/dipeptide ABC transporter ATP-binding protein